MHKTKFILEGSNLCSKEVSQRFREPLNTLLYIWQCHRLSLSYVLSYDFHISYSYTLAENDRRKLIEDLNILYNKMI